MNMKPTLDLRVCEKSLLDRSDFIRYCKELGVRTDDEELRWYEEQKLLLPTVRVYRPIGGLKKIDIEGQERFISISDDEVPTHFSLFGIGRMGYGEWLQNYDYYFPVDHPQLVPEEGWGSLQEFVDDPAELGKPSVAYYMPQQALAVDELNRHLSVTLRPIYLMRSDETDIFKTLQSFRSRFQNEKDLLAPFSEKIKRVITLTNIGLKTQAFEAQFVNEAWEKQQSKPNEGLPVADYESFYKSWSKREKKNFVKPLLEQASIKVEELIEIIDWLYIRACWKDPVLFKLNWGGRGFDKWRHFKKSTVQDRLVEKEQIVETGDPRFALECMAWIRKLIWAIEGSTLVKRKKVREKIQELQLTGVCIVCGKTLQRRKGPGRPATMTCSKKCRAIQTAVDIKLGREHGRYKNKAKEKEKIEVGENK